MEKLPTVFQKYISYSKDNQISSSGVWQLISPELCLMMDWADLSLFCALQGLTNNTKWAPLVQETQCSREVERVYGLHCWS